MARRLLHLRVPLLTMLAPRILIPSRHYTSKMRRSAFLDRMLRCLRYEISSCRPAPSPPPPPSSVPFSVDDRPGEMYVRLRRVFSAAKADGGGGEEVVKVDATMFDGAVDPTGSDSDALVPTDLDSDAVVGPAGSPRLHITVHVEVTKVERPGLTLNFECSAWPDEMEVERVFPIRSGGPEPDQPYKGYHFSELDDEMQTAMRDYLEQRGVNDELAAFLHSYMENKEQTERVRWLRIIQSHLKK